jgi:SpoU rRNA methylase family enzyme
MNLIVIEDINPAIEAVSGEIVMELRKSTSLIKDLHDLFGDIGSRTPILFGICS